MRQNQYCAGAAIAGLHGIGRVPIARRARPASTISNTIMRATYIAAILIWLLPLVACGVADPALPSGSTPTLCASPTALGTSTPVDTPAETHMAAASATIVPALPATPLDIPEPTVPVTLTVETGYPDPSPLSASATALTTTTLTASAAPTPVPTCASPTAVATTTSIEEPLPATAPSAPTPEAPSATVPASGSTPEALTATLLLPSSNTATAPAAPTPGAETPAPIATAALTATQAPALTPPIAIKPSPSPQPADTSGWQALTFPARSVRALALSPAYATDRTIVAAGGDGIYRSTDGGARWEALDAGLDGHATTWAQVAFSPDFARDRTLFLSNESRIYRSTDGGNHWVAVFADLDTDTTRTRLALSPAYAADQTIMAVNGSTSLYRSTDGGAHWSATLEPFQLFALAFPPAYAHDRTVFAAGAPAGIYRSLDGGGTWAAWSSGLEIDATDLVQTLAAVPDAAGGFSLCAGITNQTARIGRVACSGDDGASWTGATNGMEGASRITALAGLPSSQGNRILYAGTEQHGLYRSVDGGRSWRNLSPDLALRNVIALAISTDDAGAATVFIISASRLYRAVEAPSSS